MPELDIYFENGALLRAVAPMLGIIPAFFRLTPRQGKPKIAYFWPDDPNWSDFPFPVDEGVAYVFCGDGLAARAAGGAFHLRAAIKVMKSEVRNPELIALRIWHELLHAVGQPADGMIPLAEQWLPPEGLAAFRAEQARKRSVDTNYWQQQFYHWLTVRAIREEGLKSPPPPRRRDRSGRRADVRRSRARSARPDSRGLRRRQPSSQAAAPAQAPEARTPGRR
jgi:hypothetical protein